MLGTSGGEQPLLRRDLCFARFLRRLAVRIPIDLRLFAAASTELVGLKPSNVQHNPRKY